MLPRFNYNLSRWGQSVEHPGDKRRRLASFSYVDASPGLEYNSTPAEFRTYVDTAGDTIVVSINHLGEFLPPLPIFQYKDRRTSSFDASSFHREMRLSGHLFDICVGSQVRFNYAGG